LFKAVYERRDFGSFKVTTKGEKTFVKRDEGTLALLSEKARDAFLLRVAALAGETPATMEGWYYMMRAMAKPD